MRRPANDEMVQGYMDGYDLTAPEPSTNRSHSYRHGFKVGRGEKTKNYAGNYEDLERAADEAMDRDDQNDCREHEINGSENEATSYASRSHQSARRSQGSVGENDA